MEGSDLTGVHSRLLRGHVIHSRRSPVVNRFRYPLFFLLVRLDELENLRCWLLGINGPGVASLNLADYGDGRHPRQWLADLLNQAGVDDCDGPVWLQTFPRVFGYAFNPVSFWFLTRADGSLGVVVAEVNNTFGDRCFYLIPNEGEEKRSLCFRVDKKMHVSPFFPVCGEYRFEIDFDLLNPRIRIDYHDAGQLQLKTVIWGKSELLTRRALFRAILSQPFLGLGVMLRIHYQALKLWLKGVKFHPRPVPTSKTENPK